MQLKLNGKNVLLFGGHSNIGRCVSLGFAMEGAGITIACRDTEKGIQVSKEALQFGATWAEVVKCDATNYEQTKNATDTALKHGDLDIVYHGVAWDVLGDFFQLDKNLWDKIYQVNFKSVMNAWHYILPIMIKQKHGNFVNNASVMGRAHAAMEPVYGAMKSALIHLGQTIAMDVGKYGIRINFVAPGPTPPPDITNLTTGSSWLNFMQDKTIYNNTIKLWKSFSPLNQVGDIWDSAWAVLYLSSDVSGRHLTGQIIGLDGGWYLPK